MRGESGPGSVTALKRLIPVCIALVLLAAPPLYAGAPTVAGTLVWEECVALASAHHPDIVSAREKLQQARDAKGITRSALLPQVSTSLDINRTRQDASAPSQGTVDDTTYSYGITARQLLFDGGRALYDTKGADAQVRQAVYSTMGTSSAVRYGLRSAFVELLKAQELLGISDEIVERREKSLKLVSMRYNAGKEHRGALLTAEANLAQARSDRVQAGRSVSLARHKLAREMGLREWKEFMVKGDLSIPEVGAGSPDFASLASRTPAVRQAELQKEFADYARKSAEAGYFPEVYGTASAAKSDTSWPPRESQVSAGVGITLPLFEGGKRVYRSSKENAAYRQAVADFESAKGSASVTLEQKWIAFMNAIDTFGVKEKYLRASEERARIAAAQYNIGQVSFDSWIIIENELVEAKKNYLNARAGALDAEASWKNAQGVTLENDI